MTKGNDSILYPKDVELEDGDRLCLVKVRKFFRILKDGFISFLKSRIYTIAPICCVGKISIHSKNNERIKD